MKLLLVVALWFVTDATMQHHHGGGRGGGGGRPCQEFNANKTLVRQSFNGTFTNNRNVSCFFNCILEKRKFVFTNRTVNQEQLQKKLLNGVNETVKARVVNCCSAIKQTDNCEFGMDVFKCLQPTFKFRTGHCKNKTAPASG